MDNRIDLYVSEVGRHLPANTREDIEKEIRSMIEDALEDESQKTGKPVDENMVLDVLQRLGPPEKMAASYRPPRYLIGPALYPHFINTLRIVLPVLAVLSVLGLGVSLGWEARLPADFARVLGQWGMGLVNTVFQAGAIITLIFAIIERTQPDFKVKEKDWDPRSLKPREEEEAVKPAGAIAEIVFNVLAIVLVNLYPQWIAISFPRDGGWIHASVLSQAFFQYVPWMSMLWALKASLHIFLLSQGRWSPLSRWMSVALRSATIALGVAILLGPSIVALDTAALAQLGATPLDPQALARANDGLQASIRIVIGIAVAMEGLELAKMLYKMFGGKRIAVTV